MQRRQTARNPSEQFIVCVDLSLDPESLLSVSWTTTTFLSISFLRMSSSDNKLQSSIFSFESNFKLLLAFTKLSLVFRAASYACQLISFSSLPTNFPLSNAVPSLKSRALRIWMNAEFVRYSRGKEDSQRQLGSTYNIARDSLAHVNDSI